MVVGEFKVFIDINLFLILIKIKVVVKFWIIWKGLVLDINSFCLSVVNCFFNFWFWFCFKCVFGSVVFKYLVIGKK